MPPPKNQINKKTRPNRDEPKLLAVPPRFPKVLGRSALPFERQATPLTLGKRLAYYRLVCSARCSGRIFIQLCRPASIIPGSLWVWIELLVSVNAIRVILS
jgi:hypothetical protein